MPEYLRSPKFSILDAMWTVCPNKQKRGIVIPTTPATTGPEQKRTNKMIDIASRQKFGV